MKLIPKNWFIVKPRWQAVPVSIFPDTHALASPSNFQEDIHGCFWCLCWVWAYWVLWVCARDVEVGVEAGVHISP